MLRRLFGKRASKEPGVAASSEPEIVELGCPRVYSCVTCRTHTSDADSVVSKAFTGRHGRAYLVADVVNVRLGSPQDRVLLTGLHTVQDAFCASCDDRLGWRYVKAAAPSQRYKEGCFILEQARVYQEGW
jgi:hypothetical protein